MSALTADPATTVIVAAINKANRAFMLSRCRKPPNPPSR